MTTNDHNLHDACPEQVVSSDTPSPATIVSAASEGPAPDSSGQQSSGLRQALHLALRGAAYLVLAALVAIAAELVLEATRSGWGLRYVDNLVSKKPGVITVSAFVLFLLVLALLALTGRMWITAPLVVGAAGVLGVASHLKWLARREPIYPQDLAFIKEPQFLMTMVQPRTLWMAGLAFVGLIVLAWVVSRLFRRFVGSRFRGDQKPSRRWRLGVLGLRIGVLALALFMLSSLTHFNHPSNRWRLAFESAGAHWAKASQPNNYKHNGFVGGFLYNLDIPAMKQPADYSVATMQQIMRKYTAEAQRHNASLPPDALRDVNVVSILSESFSDLTRLRGITLKQDPMPYTRSLMEKVPSGHMLALKIGGGTSSMEFEVLTGMSLSQFNSALDTPYQMLVPKYRSFPSAVETFKALGHTPLAIHPYQPAMYQRDTVYPILGFKDFTSQAEMHHRARIEHGRFISDASAFQEVLDKIDSHKEPVFVNLITMQNHVPYRGQYAHPIGIQGLPKSQILAMRQYARGISYSDQAMAGLIKKLDRSKEKTIFVFYGDHLPAGTPDELFKYNSDRTMHETPFFIYKNYGKEKAEALPTTSPIFFLPDLFRVAGARITPYYALLDDLQSHVSALEDGMLIGANNRELSRDSLSPQAQQVLHDYRLVQYDLSVGNRYAARMLLPEGAPTVAASGSGQ
jgi:phosphoglycerol transferase MdoB-like AlkP superfamily enzyme